MKLILSFFLFISACFGLSLSSNAQTADTLPIAIGEWRSHLPFETSINATACDAYVAWCTGESVVLQYTDNNEISRLDKVNVLSQSDPQIIACNPFAADQLLVAYSDGALDVIEDEQVRIFTREIAEAELFGERDLNDISFASVTQAFISTEFGFLVFDPIEGVFLEDVRLSKSVLDVEVFGNDLYVATEGGLLRLADYNSRPTLRDTTLYELVSTSILNRPNDPVYALASFKDELYVGMENNIYSIDANDALRVVLTDDCLTAIKAEANTTSLVFTMDSRCSRDLVYYTSDGQVINRAETTCSRGIRDAQATNGGRLVWAGSAPAGEPTGLCSSTNFDADCDCFQLSGPRRSDVFDIDAKNGRVAVTSGGIDEQGNYQFNSGGIYVLEEGIWTNYNSTNTASFLKRNDEQERPLDLVSAAIMPNNDLYGGAYFEGLIKIDANGTDSLFDEFNSSLGNNTSDRSRVRVADLYATDEGQLWIANYEAANPISVRDENDQWYSFSVAGCGSRRLRKILVDERTGIVYATDFKVGLLAFDPGPDFADRSDDRCRLFGTDQNLPSPDIKSIALDQDGVLWIGSTNGVAKLNCGADPFDVNCNANRPTSEVDGLRGFFFDGEVINAIAVDGGNRKWLGTSSGIFLIDARTDEQLAVFNEDNSPLLTNTITSLEFDESSGRLWIGTTAGMQSLQTESTDAPEFFHEEVVVYPQPVRPDYDGPIAIKGLAQDSNVKITDMAGRLVFETNAVGGQAIWNGLDYTGRRPTSGVYLVWATADRSFDRPETVVAKIALLR